jgi:hypothetical protein
VPIAKLAGLGDTEIAVNVLATLVTFNAAVPLTPLSDAVIVLEPAANAVTRPETFVVATAVFEEFHVDVVVTFAVEPSL